MANRREKGLWIAAIHLPLNLQVCLDAFQAIGIMAKLSWIPTISSGVRRSYGGRASFGDRYVPEIEQIYNGDKVQNVLEEESTYCPGD